MSDPIGQKSFMPGRSYDLELTIKDKDFSNDIVSCQIISSVTSIYDLVKIELFIDTRDIISLVTGEDPLKLSITPLGDVFGDRQEKIDLELIYISSTYDIPIKPMIYKSEQIDRTSIPIVCITRKPFKTMTTFVNDIYIGKTLNYIIQSLVQSVGNGAILEIDTDNLNNELIDQVLIPPMTLSKAIKYLDSLFGIYNGIFNLSCKYDNTVQIKNLSKRFDKEVAFTVYQLATDDDQNLEYLHKSSDEPNVYYTYDCLNTTFGGNLKLSTLAKNINHIVKPSDKLFYQIEQDFFDLAEKYGLSFSTEDNKKLKLDSIIDRTKYYTEHTGYEETESFAIAELSKFLANTTTIDFRIERNMNILPLLETGKSIKLNSKISEYVNLTGKYILRSSILDFVKTRDWQVKAQLFLMRTNKDR